MEQLRSMNERGLSPEEREQEMERLINTRAFWPLAVLVALGMTLFFAVVDLLLGLGSEWGLCGTAAPLVKGLKFVGSMGVGVFPIWKVIVIARHRHPFPVGSVLSATLLALLLCAGYLLIRHPCLMQFIW